MCSKLCLNARDSGHFAQLLLICRNYSLQTIQALSRQGYTASMVPPTTACSASRVCSMSASRGYFPGSTIRTFIGIQRLVVPPRLVTGQVLQQVHPHIFVLRTNQPQPQQKGAESERRVISNRRFLKLRVLLVDCLCGDCHCQNNVGFDLACVQRGVEQPPLDRAVVKHRV